MSNARRQLERADVASAPPECVWCEHLFSPADHSEEAWIVCPRCQVATTSPWPSQEELDVAYGRWYRPPKGRFSGVGDRLLRRTRGRLANRVTRIAPPGPILDVGAGDGTLVKALRRAGGRAVGLERPTASGDPPQAAVAVYDTRPVVVRADLQEVTGSWAAIVFWHSLEHLPTPGKALDHAVQLLSPGGVLIVAIPNPASLQSRLFRGRWLARDIPRHLAHIPAKALVDRLAANGLDIRRLSYLRGGQVFFGWLEGLVGTLPGRLALYDAIRIPEARASEMRLLRRSVTFAAAVLLAPVALLATCLEVAARRGGTVYVEAAR